MKKLTILSEIIDETTTQVLDIINKAKVESLE